MFSLSTLTDFGLGLVLGSVGGLFGIGGGLIAIPVLVWLFSMSQPVAQGTALVMIAPNVLLGFWRYRHHNPIAWRPAVLLGVSSIASTYAAARLAAGLDARHLRTGFACFLLGLAIYLLWELRRSPKPTAAPVNQPESRVWPEWALALLGLVSGVFSGFFTVGGGLIVAPALTRFFGVQRQTMAQGLSLATVTPGALVALMTYGAAGRVNWSMGVPLAVGGMLSISWGVDWAHRLPERLLRALFCGLLAVTGAALLRP